MRIHGCVHYSVLFVFCVISSQLVLNKVDPECLAQSRGSKKNKKTKVDFEGWGQLGKAVRGADGFYEVTYFSKGEGKKAKLRKTKAFLMVPEDTAVYRDKSVSMKALKPETEALVFGRPITVQGGDPKVKRSITREYQIIDTRVVVGGDLEGFGVDMKYKMRSNPKLKWCKVGVVKISGGLVVNFERKQHKVALAKKSPILLRAKVSHKQLKGKVFIRIRANRTDERPSSRKKKSDAEIEAFVATDLVILDRSALKTAYPLLWAQ